MPFKPAFEKHAIEACEFSFAVLPAFNASRLQRLREVCLTWSEELPSLQLINSESVRDSAIVPLTTARSKQGLRYSYMRPNGFPVWELVIANNEIRIVCTRYASWSAVWAFASHIFSTLFDALAEFDPETNEEGEHFELAMAALRYEDRFVSPETPFDFTELFRKENELLPKRFTNWGEVWHHNAGWYDTDENPAGLNLLSVSSSTSNDSDSRSCEVTVEHTIQARLFDPGDTTNFLRWSKSGAELAFEAMDNLHTANKSLLADLLSDTMLEMIGITSS